MTDLQKRVLKEEFKQKCKEADSIYDELKLYMTSDFSFLDNTLKKKRFNELNREFARITRQIERKANAFIRLRKKEDTVTQS